MSANNKNKVVFRGYVQDKRIQTCRDEQGEVCVKATLSKAIENIKLNKETVKKGTYAYIFGSLEGDETVFILWEKSENDRVVKKRKGKDIRDKLADGNQVDMLFNITKNGYVDGNKKVYGWNYGSKGDLSNYLWFAEDAIEPAPTETQGNTSPDYSGSSSSYMQQLQQSQNLAKTPTICSPVQYSPPYVPIGSPSPSLWNQAGSLNFPPELYMLMGKVYYFTFPEEEMGLLNPFQFQ